MKLSREASSKLDQARATLPPPEGGAVLGVGDLAGALEVVVVVGEGGAGVASWTTFGGLEEDTAGAG
jgi:hypothetical protein